MLPAAAAAHASCMRLLPKRGRQDSQSPFQSCSGCCHVCCAYLQFQMSLVLLKTQVELLGLAAGTKTESMREVQAEYDGALSGSVQDAQQASTMSASLAKTNWINSGLRSQVLPEPLMLPSCQPLSITYCHTAQALATVLKWKPGVLSVCPCHACLILLPAPA